MIENGMRLQITVLAKDFTVIDTLTDRTIIYRNGLFISDNIPHESVTDNITGLVQLIADSSMKKKLNPVSTQQLTCGVSISETEHCSARMMHDKEEGVLKDQTITCTRKFDRSEVLNALNRVVYTLAKEGNTIVNPKGSLCRTVSALGLFVIKDSKHQLTVMNRNRVGNTLLHCLFDDTTFNWLYVDIHADENKMYLFNGEFNEVASFDCDESVAVYFEVDKDVFKEVNENVKPQ